MSDSGKQPLKIGFVALVDCAPLAMAHEKGYFEEQDLEVQLIREPGWASIRDKIVYNELDAAHALVGLCFAISMGIGVQRRNALTGFLMNSNGDTIVLANHLMDKTGNPSLNKKKLTLAVPHWFSSHHFLLRQWLAPKGVKEGREYEVIVIPPALMVATLREGYIDGFCVGEPYGSVAEAEGLGWLAKESADLSPMHPEKALLVTEKFAVEDESRHLRLIASLIKAAEYCDTRPGREELADILSQPTYLGMEKSVIRQSLIPDTATLQNNDFHLFSKFGVNQPTKERANWLVNHMRKADLISTQVQKDELRMDQVFRSDIYQAASELCKDTNRATKKDLVAHHESDS